MKRDVVAPKMKIPRRKRRGIKIDLILYSLSDFDIVIACSFTPLQDFDDLPSV